MSVALNSKGHGVVAKWRMVLFSKSGHVINKTEREVIVLQCWSDIWRVSLIYGTTLLRIWFEEAGRRSVVVSL